MSHCDFLIAPSEFLRDRFVSWGVSGEAITVIENSLDPDALLDKQEGGANHRRVVGSAEIMGKYSLGYFGQINPFKGLHVLLDAIQLLPNDVREAIHVGIHGANLEIQAPDFQERIEQALKIAGDCVFNYGPYENDNVVDLMRGYDRIVVPSIWWENSPVVIQEARLAGTPLLCSHLGGMAEKAKSSLDIHFQVGSPVSLATEIVKLVGAPERPRTAFADLISEQKLALSAHLALYRAVLTQA
jgi:glycosyltransferase involved in cell wall biosynthesis